MRMASSERVRFDPDMSTRHSGRLTSKDVNGWRNNAFALLTSGHVHLRHGGRVHHAGRRLAGAAVRSSLTRLLGLPGLFEEEFARLGRLDEGEGVEQNLARGKYLKMGADALAWPGRRSSRPSSGGRTSFHFAHSAVAKAARPPGAVPTEPTRDGRVFIYPGRGEVPLARSAGAMYDRRAGAWWVREASPAADKLAALRTPEARHAWELSHTSTGRSQRATPAEFQRYVERARLAPEHREEIERDADGAISLGSIGEREAERARFWAEVALRERSDGRVQCRIIAELPHEVTPQGRRRIVDGFADVFRERGLPFHAAVHRPDTAKGMDPRNVHLHLVYHDRPAWRVSRNAWAFGERKDRGAQGRAWISALRSRLAVEANRELERESAARTARGEPPIARRLDPRSYREMEIEKPPGRHLGPVASAFDRAGRPTPVGVANAVEEAVWDMAERARALSPLVERWVAMRRRVEQLPPSHRDPVRHAMEEARLALVEAAPRDPERSERIQQRKDWAVAEGAGLDDRLAEHRARATAGGSMRGVVLGERLDAMQRRRRRVSEIEAEASALLAAIGQTATGSRTPIATASQAIMQLLDRIEQRVLGAERASRPLGYER